MAGKFKVVLFRKRNINHCLLKTEAEAAMNQLIRRAAFVVGAIAFGNLFLWFVFNAEAMMPRNNRIGDPSSSEVRNSCYVAEWRLRDKDLPHWPSDFVSLSDEPQVRTLTAGLHCMMVTKPNAICDRDDRAVIVGAISRYFDKRDAMLAKAKSIGADQLSAMDRFWNSRRNQQISSALEAAIREGKLNKSDFGWSVPPALKPLLTQYAKAPDRCTQRTAAKSG